MLVEKGFETGKVVLNYAEGPPNGPPIWLLHGFMSNWKTFNPIYPYLQSRWHIFATDLRGHGKSERTAGHYGLGYYYRDLQHFMDKKITEPVTLIGHSKGGVLSCMLASKNTDKVKGVILLDPPLFIADVSKKNPWWEIYHKIVTKEGTVKEKIKYAENLEVKIEDEDFKWSDLADPASVWWWSMDNFDPSILEEKLKTIDNEGASRQYYDWYKPEEVIPLIDCPVLLIQAGIGGTLPDSHVDEAKDWFKDLIHIKLEGLDHGLGITKWSPSEVLRPISYFLEAIH